MRRFGFIPIALATCLSAHAAEAPPQLRGNSIVVRWNEDRIQRHVGEPNFYPVAASHVLSIYVSGEGRVFTRQVNTTRAGSGGGDQVAGLGKPDVPQRVPDFDGRTMYVYLPFNKGGMRRATIEFEADYKTCKARVALAREEGATEVLAFSPITKKMVEFKSVKTSTQTCTLRTGNIFSE